MVSAPSRRTAAGTGVMGRNLRKHYTGVLQPAERGPKLRKGNGVVPKSRLRVVGWSLHPRSGRLGARAAVRASRCREVGHTYETDLDQRKDLDSDRRRGRCPCREVGVGAPASPVPVRRDTRGEVAGVVAQRRRPQRLNRVRGGHRCCGQRDREAHAPSACGRADDTDNAAAPAACACRSGDRGRRTCTDARHAASHELARRCNAQR